MYSLSQSGARMIKGFEGLRLFCYICASGKLTIGYGHRIYTNKIKVITLAQAEEYFQEDVQLCLNEIVEPNLKSCEVDSIVSFIFNIGVGAWRGSTARKALLAGDCAVFLRELLLWVHDDHGNVIPDLRRRRAAEAQHFQGK